MFGVGLSELLVILLLCLLLFGANRLPEIGKSLGEGIREFKNSLKESEEKSSQIQDKQNKEE